LGKDWNTTDIQEGEVMSNELGPPHQRLAALVGRWRTEGWTIATAEAPAARIEAVDTYEWLPGGYALLHTVDARVGEQKVEGAEIIGWDPARGSYITQYFGSDGPNGYEAGLADVDGALVWTMTSAEDRFTGTFSNDGNTITGHWEQLDDERNWHPWMDVTLTRARE
jgi:Protein of unknown function (DUF1579)